MVFYHFSILFSHFEHYEKTLLLIIHKSVNIWDWIAENVSKVWIKWDKGFHINS